MDHDSLQQRGHAMEELFFHNQDKELINRLRSELHARENRTALAAATGIENEAVLNDLLAHGITAETLASVGLIPLIAVAWADGKMEAREHQAILRATRDSGIEEGSAAYKIIEGWLRQQPGSDLFQAWKDYITTLRSALEPASLLQVRNNVVGRAKNVAEAAGGFLGVVNTVSADERRVLQELTAAFDE